jgi:hypothetical protein
VPLSSPARRKPIHNRTIVCDGYRRDDGLWDIEGHLTDSKRYLFKNPWRGGVKPGEPVHEMWARLTLDEQFTVVAVECVSDNGPFATCGAIVGNFQRLVGQKVGPGWSRRVKSLVGGIEGCAHHVELLCLLATVAFQTMGPLLARRNDGEVADAHPSFVINSCHIWRADGEMARNYFPGDWTLEIPPND